MARTVSNIIEALQTLGVHGKAGIQYVQADRVKVSLDGEYFGMWDSEKGTFVD